MLIAQNIENGNKLKKENIFLGGNLGLQFGNVTIIDVSPIVGYKVTEKFSIGIGAKYQYINYRDYNYSFNVYGGSIFGRYNISDYLFAHVEYEVLNMPSIVNMNDIRTNVSSLFVGGGYRQKISKNSSFNIMGLWNLNESLESPYTNPIIRISLDIGL